MSLLKRRIPYAETYHLSSSNTNPLFAGFHRSEGPRNDGKFHGAFTLRYPEGYYVMVPRTRKGGGVQVTRKNVIPLRCREHSCKAKCKIECANLELIYHHDYRTLRSNPDIWTIHQFPADIPHTCVKTFPCYYSDKINFSEDYRKYKADFADVGGDGAWGLTCRDWRSGLGADFDAIIFGTKSIHVQKAARDRRHKFSDSSNCSSVMLVSHLSSVCQLYLNGTVTRPWFHTINT